MWIVPASRPASAPSSSSPACKAASASRARAASRLPASVSRLPRQSLPRRGLEQAQMLARGRLTDADRAGCGGHRALPVDLDEQTEPGGVPEERERCIGQGDGRYRKIRLVQY